MERPRQFDYKAALTKEFATIADQNTDDQKLATRLRTLENLLMADFDDVCPILEETTGPFVDSELPKGHRELYNVIVKRLSPSNPRVTEDGIEYETVDPSLKIRSWSIPDRNFPGHTLRHIDLVRVSS